jgi:hypothetical protein
MQIIGEVEGDRSARRSSASGVSDASSFAGASFPERASRQALMAAGG